jgi:hypothetical protein
MMMKIPDLQKSYRLRYAFRLCVLAFALAMYFAYPQSFDVLEGVGFFHEFSWLHLLWLIWVADMILQLIPVKGFLPLGSLKQFGRFYKPVREPVDTDRLDTILKKTWVEPLKVLGLWVIPVAGLGFLYRTNVLKESDLLLISVVFYVLDMTFVLFWCPFRAWILKTRCCTTCRIFNWDHVMMFSPLLFIRGFYPISLFGLAAVVFIVWEVCFILHPERFYEETNAALSCHNCTDRLCGDKSRK